MAQNFRYARRELPLEYYRESWVQTSPPPPGGQPPMVTDFVPVLSKDTIQFEPGEVDTRMFLVNTPTGDTLGTVHGYLADMAHSSLPYTYVVIEGSRVVVVPTDMLTRYPEYCLVTFYWGKNALAHAPDANFDQGDAARANRYWGTFRRQQAA